jgi:CRISPR/Cas system Type II protein with McrA/HNH and RuvC-like nuclease domain
MAPQIISRDEAIRLGQNWYFTGKPCKHGHVDKRRVDNWCCVQCERDKATRFRQQFPAVQKARTQAWRDANEEYVCKYNKFNHDRWLARPGNIEQHRESAKDWYHQNTERGKARVAAWILANPERHREHSRNAKAKRKKAEGSHTAADIAALFAEQNGLCLCGVVLETNGKDRYHVDHIIPLSRGGTNYPDNLQLLCRPCNRSKGTKTMQEWRPKWRT